MFNYTKYVFNFLIFLFCCIFLINVTKIEFILPNFYPKYKLLLNYLFFVLFYFSFFFHFDVVNCFFLRKNVVLSLIFYNKSIPPSHSSVAEKGALEERKLLETKCVCVFNYWK